MPNAGHFRLQSTIMFQQSFSTKFDCTLCGFALSAKDHWPSRTIAFPAVWFWTTTQMGFWKCAPPTQSVFIQPFLFASNCTIPSPNTLPRKATFSVYFLCWKVFSGGSKWNRLSWTSACNQEPLWGGREELRLRCGELPTQAIKLNVEAGWLAKSSVLMQIFLVGLLYIGSKSYLRTIVNTVYHQLFHIQSFRDILLWKQWGGINQWSPPCIHPSW